MSHRLPCPNGHVLLIPPKLEGKRIKCPKCQAVMEVPIMTAAEEEEEEIITEAAEESPPKPPALPLQGIKKSSAPRRSTRRNDDDDDDDDDRPRRGTRDEDDEPRPRRHTEYDDDEVSEPSRGKIKNIFRQQMRATRLGLLFFYIQFILYLATIFAHLSGSTLKLMGGQNQALGNIGLLISGFGILATFLLAPIVGIVGGSFIVRVAPKSGARGLAIATLVLEIIPVACGLLAQLNGVLSFGGPTPEQIVLSLFFTIMATLSMLAGFILFMIFLKRLSFYLKDRSTGEEVQSLMVGFLANAVGGPLLIIFSIFFLFNIGLACLASIIVLAILIGWFVLIIKQLFGILKVIATVRARIFRAG